MVRRTFLARIFGAGNNGVVDGWKWKRESAGQMRWSNSLVEFEGEIPWINCWVKFGPTVQPSRQRFLGTF